jgi:hypothetical protein
MSIYSACVQQGAIGLSIGDVVVTVTISGASVVQWGLTLVLVEESTHTHITHTSFEARNTQTDRVEK